jgi:hypothetical protein
MPTLVLDPPPHELQELLERRKRSGLHREIPRETWFPTAALVVEIVAPGDGRADRLALAAIAARPAGEVSGGSSRVLY